MGQYVEVECPHCHEMIPKSLKTCPACKKSTKFKPAAIKTPTWYRNPDYPGKICSTCGSNFEERFDECPSCRRLYRENLFKVIFVLSFCAIIGSCVLFLNRSPAPPPPPTAEEIAKKAEEDAQKAERFEKYSAQSMAKEFVLRFLKSPSTAKFQDTDEYLAAKNDNGEWVVVGYVDAQNSFGAMLRNHFKCTLIRNGENWRLIDLKMVD